MTGKKAPNFLLYSILGLLTVSSLFSQDGISDIEALPNSRGKEIDWNQIHLAGFTYNESLKTLESTSGSNTSEIEYSIRSLGVNYANFSGSLFGFFSDLYILIPLQSKLESEEQQWNSGLSLDYTGSIAWFLQGGPIGFLPFFGFHGQYSFLMKDPLDDNMSNHLLSFGISGGLKILVRMNEKNNLYAGIKGSFDTIELTSASYDSREIQLKNKMSYMVSLGYAYTAPVSKRMLQSDTLE